MVEELFCPAGHSLMSRSVHIHEEPSIRLRVRSGAQEGLIFVDAYWGSHDKLYSFLPTVVDMGSVLQVFCPTCGVSLVVEERCEQQGCGSDRCILFRLPPGRGPAPVGANQAAIPGRGPAPVGGTNSIYVCARLGCPWHRMDISRMPDAVQRSVSEINYFGHGEEEAFQGI